MPPVTDMKPSLLIYIHGFNSSPQSHKAMLMQQYCQQHRPDIKVLVPQLPCFPNQSEQLLLQLVEQYRDHYQIGLVGSSLGGYFSIWLNQQFAFRAVLVNPAVKPYELLVDYLGDQLNPYTGEQYVLLPQHVQQLKELDVEQIARPDSMWLLQQTADEVLDYRQAVEKLSLCKQTVEQGGDHSFVDFERFPQSIIEFLQL